MFKKIPPAVVATLTIAAGGLVLAQNLATVQGSLPAPIASGFTSAVSQPSSISVVTRGAGGAAPARYADLPLWSPWLAAATNILETANLDFVDITSLTFFEPNQRNALLRAIAYNILDNRLNRDFTVKAGGSGKLHVRLLFGQGVQADTGFGGHASTVMAPQIANAFLTQIPIAYNNKYGANAFTTPNNLASPNFWAQDLNNVVEFGVMYAFWGSAPGGTPAGGAWNHSKIVSNGQVALVGGTNMYTEYLTQPDGTGVILDTDLLVGGWPAIYSSRWVDTLFTDYRRQKHVVADLGIITFTSEGPLSGPTRFINNAPPPRRCTCAVNVGAPFCANNPAEGIILPYSTRHTGCFWGGWQGGRLDTGWLGYGAAVNAAPAAMPNAPTVISVGERGTAFVNTAGITAAHASAYDYAIGRLIWSADDNPGTEIMIAQQDLLNGSAFGLTETTRLEGNATWQRWYLAERIAYDLMKPPEQQHLRVYIIKSNGTGYDTYHLYQVVDALWQNVMERYEYQWTHANPPKLTPWNTWRTRMRTTIEDQFCSILRAAKFVNNLQWTRLHSKMVMVVSPTTNRAAVSVGSLNFYNALMMNDYGNIVFDDHSAGTVTRDLHNRINTDWNAANYPNLASDTDGSNPRHCSWQDPCASAANCGACTPRSTCGWCKDTNSCMSGTAAGATIGGCRAAAWAWSPNQCN